MTPFHPQAWKGFSPSQPCGDGALPILPPDAEPSASEREAYRQHLIATEGVNVTGHPDGWCIRYGGEVVETWPDSAGVRLGQQGSHLGLFLLAACLHRRS